MKVLVVRGSDAFRTTDKISKLVRKEWGARSHWWIEHFDGFALVFDRPYTVTRNIGYEVIQEQ